MRKPDLEWIRYCEAKAEAMDAEARAFELHAEAAAINPLPSEGQRAVDVAHSRKLAADYRGHAEDYRAMAERERGTNSSRDAA